jgi:hypothetical protein
MECRMFGMPAFIDHRFGSIATPPQLHDSGVVCVAFTEVDAHPALPVLDMHGYLLWR